MSDTKTPDAPAKGDVANGETSASTALTKTDLEKLNAIDFAGGINLMEASALVAKSGMFPDIKRSSQAGVKMLLGYELGIAPMRAVMGIHWIQIGDQSRLEPSAELRAQLIKRSGRYDYRVRESDWTHCKIEWFEREPNGGPFVSSGFSEYSVEDAKRMKLAERGKWKEDSESMCFHAALRRGCRKYAPDVTLGGGAGDVDDGEAVLQVAEVAQIGEHEDIVDGEITHEKAEGGDGHAAGTTASDAENATGGGSGPEEASGASDGDVVARTEDEPDGTPKQGEKPTPEAASGNADGGPETPPSDSLFDGPLTEPADGEEVAPDEPVYVGVIAVQPAPDGPHEPANDTAERITDTRIKELRNLMPRLSLVPGALESVFKARYGFEVREAKVAQADAFEEYINDESAKMKAGAK